MVIMNRYEFIKSIEPQFTNLIKLGFISVHFFDWIIIYEWYLIERKTNGIMQSYSNTAEYRRPALSEGQVRKIVKYMESLN